MARPRQDGAVSGILGAATAMETGSGTLAVLLAFSGLAVTATMAFKRALAAFSGAILLFSGCRAKAGGSFTTGYFLRPGGDVSTDRVDK